MKNCEDILCQHLSEQIALEEHLLKKIESQISEIDQTSFIDVKNLLAATCLVLEKHYKPLNDLLDSIERNQLKAVSAIAAPNGRRGEKPLFREQTKKSLSKLLRDDYSALNLITLSNTLLHTAALALNAQEVATLALQHLENLAPLVIKMGVLAPEVIIRELQVDQPDIALTVAQTALKNARKAWQSAA